MEMDGWESGAEDERGWSTCSVANKDGRLGEGGNRSCGNVCLRYVPNVTKGYCEFV